MLETRRLAPNEQLKLNLSVILVRDKLTFMSTIGEFQSRLRHWFKVDYTADEVETALGQLENSLIEESETVMEIPEDYELVPTR